MTFLKQRVHAGVFWILRAGLPESRAKQLFDAWGNLFEEWVHSQLGPEFGDRYIKNPGPPHQEITDALIDYVGEVVLIECKGSFIRENLKYGRNPSLLFEYLDDRFLQKDQIPSSIRRLLGKDGAGTRAKLALPGISKVYPVLVCHDQSISSPLIERELDSLLRSRLVEQDIPATTSVMPLTVVCADDVLFLKPFLRAGLSLKSILDERFSIRESMGGDPMGRLTFRNSLTIQGHSRGIPEEQRFEPASSLLLDASRFWTKAQR